MEHALRPITRPAPLLGVLLALGCASDLVPSEDGEAHSSLEAGGIQTTENDDGTHTTVVDASDNDIWLAFDFESGEQVDSDGDSWDISFQRFKIKSNGGISGDGAVAVAVLDGEDFEALEHAPDGEYVEDADDGDDEDEDPDFAFLTGDGWYAYDPADHTLSPRDAVYVVRTAEESFFKVEMLGYYDDAGTSGYPTFAWAEVEPPTGEITVVASVGTPADAEGEEAEGDGEVTDGSFGCYEPAAHMCECETDETSCDAAGGIWSGECPCGEG